MGNEMGKKEKSRISLSNLKQWAISNIHKQK